MHACIYIFFLDQLRQTESDLSVAGRNFRWAQNPHVLQIRVKANPSSCSEGTASNYGFEQLKLAKWIQVLDRRTLVLPGSLLVRPMMLYNITLTVCCSRCPLLRSPKTSTSTLAAPGCRFGLEVSADSTGGDSKTSVMLLARSRNHSWIAVGSCRSRANLCLDSKGSSLDAWRCHQELQCVWGHWIK